MRLRLKFGARCVPMWWWPLSKKLALEGLMHAILQILSLSLLEVKPLAQLLNAPLLADKTGEPKAQFCLFPEISGR